MSILRISQIFVNTYLNKINSTPNATPESMSETENIESVSSASDVFNLTKREKQILKLIIDGQSNREIAIQLDKSVRTIETHRFKIMKKLNVHNAIEMLKVVEENNLF